MNLESLLQYKNNDVLNRYRKDYPNNTLLPEEAFSELLKFFWLSGKHKLDVKKNPKNVSLRFHCAMHREMKEIDDMWHTFLLFTRDYTDFSVNYFGSYIHHSPNTKGGMPEGEKYKTELTRYFSYIYDNLGEETLKRWFKSTLEEST